jgi:hypothetical protein
METKIPGVDGDEEITVHNTYLNLKVRVSEIVNAVEILKRRTRANNISTAIELTFFASLPTDEMESVGLLITIIRCVKDGSVAPPFDIEKLYNSIALPP